MQLEENALEYSTALEREVLRLNKRLISKPYRRHMRRLTLRLRKDNDIGKTICILNSRLNHRIFSFELTELYKMK